MIILQILKVIGIVLACVLGFVLLILLLVMFLPFNYSLKGKGKGADITAQAAVRWLCGFVTVMAIYEGKKISYYLRVCGIKVFKGTLGNKKEDVPSGDEASEEAESAPAGEDPGAETRENGSGTENPAHDRPDADPSARTDGSAAAGEGETVNCLPDFFHASTIFSASTVL